MNNKPLLQLNGWKTVSDYAKSKSITYRHVFKLIRKGEVETCRLQDLNNLQLVKDKPNGND